MTKTIVIDASSTSPGGGMTYLKEFLKIGLKTDINFEIICSNKLNPLLPISENIKVVNHPFLNRNLLFRYLYKFFLLEKSIKTEANVLISLSGDYLGSFKPYLGVCQNMLLYEKNKRDGMSFFDKLKFEILKIIQIWSFRKSSGVIFLSNHAKNVVSRYIGKVPNKVINFGISQRFLNSNRLFSKKGKNKFLYVSSIHTYKKQFELILAFKELINEGYNIELSLVGPILNKKYWNKVKKIIDEINQENIFIKHYNFVNHEKIHSFYNNHKYFIFPSICENMPNIVMEATASKIPVLSSQEEPMPEFLKKNAVYFNSHDHKSIKEMIIYSIENYDEMKYNSINAFKEVFIYSWEKNFKSTLDFIEEINAIKR